MWMLLVRVEVLYSLLPVAGNESSGEFPVNSRTSHARSHLQTSTWFYFEVLALWSLFCNISFCLLSPQRLYYLLCFMSQKKKGVLFTYFLSGKI
ncbi:unnamed protein product [Lathyrus oleraceus]